MKDIYIGVKFCFSYFSILPVNISNDIDVTKDSIIKSFLFFLPFIGLVLGVLTVSIYYIFESYSYLGLIVASISYMVLYGFLHTEAIADVVDALYAKHSGKDAYKVIKEPTIGAMGLLYTIVFVLLKIAVIMYIFEQNLFYEFIAVLVFSRLALVFNIYLFDIHEKSTFILMMKKNISKIFLLLALIFSSVIVILLTSFYTLALGFLVLVICMFVVKILQSKLNFVNGDVLGTSLEVGELISLFLLIVLI
ncbi:MAG TPA: adenosylcobinamide-GDP ribazoletransferase [Arcobacter sp.]|nr:adenosylcobinamide-GDP ribazoletransferase [Arcobacter sp.]HIP56054.1 adenosylcobinamide-GDP ribazoletransferase [Arcobacter sp.]